MPAYILQLLQPCEKLPHGTSVGERLHDVARRPPLLGNIRGENAGQVRF
jgi:hypothetical protein